MKTALVRSALLSLLLACGAALAQGVQMDSPAQRALNAFLDAFNSGDTDH
jgi:hypothetical protein